LAAIPAGARYGGVISESGDYVIETSSAPEAQAKMAEVFELFGMCSAARAIPAGVYLAE
jgi:hypothetical protein